MTKELEKKLDILIKLNAANLIKEDKTQAESILRLSNAGIDSSDIARILGATTNTISTAIARGKKKNDK